MIHRWLFRSLSLSALLAAYETLPSHLVLITMFYNVREAASQFTGHVLLLRLHYVTWLKETSILQNLFSWLNFCEPGKLTEEEKKEGWYGFQLWMTIRDSGQQPLPVST